MLEMLEMAAYAAAQLHDDIRPTVARMVVDYVRFDADCWMVEVRAFDFERGTK